MPLLAVIVNYQTPELTLRSLAALIQESKEEPDWSVAVIDNCSGDGSFERLSRVVEDNGWSDRVSVLESEHNGGFGCGINLAVRPALESAAPPDYVYVVNPDAVVGPGGVRRLVRFLDEHHEVGIAGSVIEDFDGNVRVGGFRFPSLLSQLEEGLRLGIVSRLLTAWRLALPIPDRPEPVDWISGTSMLIRSEVFRTIGYFDESFFLYFEETDFCQRARSAGWSVWSVPESRVAHLVSASTGLEDHNRRRPAYWFASRSRYFRKHHGTAYLWAANVVWASAFALWRLRRLLQQKPDIDPPRLLRDFIRHSFTKPSDRTGSALE